MHHGFKTLLLLFTVLTLAGCSSIPIASKRGKLQTIAFYNTEKLFDTKDDPETNDDPFTPDGEMEWTEERYRLKLQNIATVIAGIGGKNGPDIIGLSEVENRQVVDDLLNTPPLRRAGYNVIHQEMNDEQGLDLALLYKPKAFKPVSVEFIKINFQESGYTSRDILQVKGELQGELVTIYVNHWPARGRARSSKRDDQRLQAAATTLRQEIDKQQKVDHNAKIIVMGDFDVEPNASVLEKTLNFTGRPDPAYPTELFNTHYLLFVNGRGSYAYQGDFQMLDQIMVSKSMIGPKEGLEYVRGSAKIYNPVAIKYTLGRYRESPKGTYSGTVYRGGYSDHFPVFIQVRRSR